MIYILSQDYPNTDNKYAMSYVHSRNIIYKEQNLELIVVSMSAKAEYKYEGIRIITKDSFIDLIKRKALSMNDIIISHAPNLKNHLPIINKVYLKVKKVIFFFHGHEVLNTKNYYPKEFDFKNERKYQLIIHSFYDVIKLKIIKSFLKKVHRANKLKIVCVSNWMKEHAARCLDLNLDDFDVSIINNNANSHFLEYQYKMGHQYFADFITVRPLDKSKYAVDLVVKFAENNPRYKFHIYGKGVYFEHCKKPSNIEVINKFVAQKDFPELLNKYRCAIMPTRLDAQGVMVCEMATYGIPVITSDLEVCREMLIDFQNVYLAEEDFFYQEIEEDFIEKNLITKAKMNKFNIENTVQKEIELLKNI